MKKVIAHLLIALVATLVSSFVPGEVVDRIPGSMDCVDGCTFVAGGWPVPYLVDHHGISPAGSVSLLMGLTGDDHIWKTELLLTFTYWLAVSCVLRYVLIRWQKSK